MVSGNKLEPKISLLKAHTLGRLNGLDVWKESLMEVATTFSAFDEGIHAKNIIDKIDQINDLEGSRVVYKNYKWIFPFNKLEREKTDFFYIKLKGLLASYNKLWTLSLDTYNMDYVFVVVHGIRDPQNIEIFKDRIQFSSSSTIEEQNFVALTSQYRDYIKNKTWKNAAK